MTAGLIGEMSGTGFVMLALVYGAFIVKSLYKVGFKYILRYLVVLSLFVVSFNFISNLIKSENPVLYEQIVYTGGNRLNLLLGKDEEYNTLEIRAEQFELQEARLIRNTFKKLFGVGVVYATSDTSKLVNPKTIFIEDQYSLNQITIGLVGNFLMIAFFVSLVIRIIRRNDIDINIKTTYSLFVGLFALSCKNVCPFNSYSTLVLFALCYVLIIENIHQERWVGGPS